MSSLQRLSASLLSASKTRSVSALALARTSGAYGPQIRSKHYLAASSKDFDERMKNHDGRLVIVDFYADWCGPCRMLSPVLEKVTSNTEFSNGKEVDLVTINTDEEASLAQKYQVTALPTVIAFRDGKPLDKFVGAQSASIVQKWVRHLSA